MERLAADYPAYGWERNKGYPTREHRLAVHFFFIEPLLFPCQTKPVMPLWQKHMIFFILHIRAGVYPFDRDTGLFFPVG